MVLGVWRGGGGLTKGEGREQPQLCGAGWGEGGGSPKQQLQPSYSKLTLRPGFGSRILVLMLVIESKFLKLQPFPVLKVSAITWIRAFHTISQLEFPVDFLHSLRRARRL